MANPISIRVRLRYADLDTFVERFAPNVTRGGIFLASKSPRPVGDVFPFEVQLANGQVALSGEGKVIWIKEFDPAEPQRPHGMGVQFTRIDPASRETLNRILRAKGAQPGGGPRPPSQPVKPLSGHGGTNGTASKPHVDTSVDLAAEYGVDDTTLRLTVERYRLGAGRAAPEDDVEGLLKPQAADPPPTLNQALADLPRLLDPTRRRTGAFRPLEEYGAAADKPAAEKPPADGAAKADPPKDPEGGGGSD